MAPISRPGMASPSPRGDLGDDGRVLIVRRGFDDGLGPLAGSALLKMPEPTNTPSAPSCIMRAASAGVAMPPAEKLTTGSLPFLATQATSSYGACRSLAAR